MITISSLFNQLIAGIEKPIRLVSLLYLFLGLTVMAHSQTDRISISKSEIQQIITQRVKEISGNEDNICIVVGIVSPQGKQLISYGHPGEKSGQELDGNTLFEIGSVTKVFTGLLVAQMVHSGELELHDPVSKYLPEGIKLPEFNGHKISLLDLVTHTSGLQFMPTIEIKDRDGLYKYIASYKLISRAGTDWDYSNLGYWLLSEALAYKAKVKFEEALKDRILTPLNLTNTVFALSGDMKNRLAIGHDASLQKAPLISSIQTYSIMPAAGGLYSSVNDLMKLLSVTMGYEKQRSTKIISQGLQISRPIGGSRRQSLGWVIIKEESDSLIYHDGNTFGYSSCIMFDAKAKVGVVILSNHTNSVDDIAHHILRNSFPLKHATKITQEEISLDSQHLDQYVGKFDGGGEGVFEVKKNGNLLSFEAPGDWGLPKLLIHPINPNEFVAHELPLRVTFQQDSAGKWAQILIYPPRGQKSIPATRVD